MVGPNEDWFRLGVTSMEIVGKPCLRSCCRSSLPVSLARMADGVTPIAARPNVGISSTRVMASSRIFPTSRVRQIGNDGNDNGDYKSLA